MKHLKYLKYVLIHKWFVFIAGRALGVSLWRIIKHDWSKFTPTEWFAYANYFYTDNGDLLKFRKAWLHHIHKNDHHPQHHILINDDDGTTPLPMTEQQIREMLADWFSAGHTQYLVNEDLNKVFPDMLRWWSERGSHYIYHDETRQRILELIPVVQERIESKYYR